MGMNSYNVIPLEDRVYVDPGERQSRIPTKQGGCFVMFFEQEVPNNYKSKIEGRPILESRTFIRKIADAQSEFIREVRDSDKEEYPEQWIAFQNNKESRGIIGTMLGDYAKASGNLSESQIEHLRAYKVYTVEQLSELADTQLQIIGSGTRQMKTDASLWLEERKSGTLERKLTAELEELKTKYDIALQAINDLNAQPKASSTEMDALKQQNAELMQMNKEMLEMMKQQKEEPPKKKRGRPKKVVELPDFE